MLYVLLCFRSAFFVVCPMLLVSPDYYVSPSNEGKHIVLVLLFLPLLLSEACPDHNCFVFRDRSMIFGMWVHDHKAVCRVPHWSSLDLDRCIFLVKIKKYVPFSQIGSSVPQTYGLTHDVGISWNMSLSIGLYHVGSNVRSHSNPESFTSTAEHCIPLCDIDGSVTAYIHGSEGGNVGIGVVSGSK